MTEKQRSKLRADIIEAYETAIGIARLRLKQGRAKEAEKALDDACDEVDKLTGFSRPGKGGRG